MSRRLLVLVAVMAAQCGGRSGPTAPTAPTPASGIGVVQSITVDRTNIEAGDEIALHVIVGGIAPSSQLRYSWSVDPAGGTLTSDGASARWRSPLNDPVPATYTFLVSVVQPAGSGSAFRLVSTNAGPAATSPPVTVNDARREMQAHSEAFLADSVNPAVSPGQCVRNFADSCEGKRTALEEIAANRAIYSAGTTSFTLELFVRSIEWPNCTAPDRSARCAVLIYRVSAVRTRRADGAQEQVAGDQYIQGVYEGNRWWLCSSRLDAGATAR